MGASTAERMRVVDLLLPVDSAAVFDRPEEGSGDRDPSEVSDIISLPISGAAAPPASAVSAVASVPAPSSPSEPVLQSVPAAAPVAPATVAAPEPSVAPASNVVHGVLPSRTTSAGHADPAAARVTPPMSDAFSESIQRWMRQGDSLSERGIRAAEDLSDLDEGIAPVLRGRAIRAARLRRWLSVAAAVVVGSVAAVWVTQALSPTPARPVVAAPAASARGVAAPPPSATQAAGSAAAAMTAPAAPAPTAAAVSAKAPAASHSRAQPQRRHAAVARHHRRR
jgi:hypothetical protein